MVDPFLPIHLIVPNHVLGTLLSRALFADTGYVAIHVELSHEFAWNVVAHESLGSGLLPVPDEVDLAIVLNAAAGAVSDASTPEYLKRAVPMPGFAPAAPPAGRRFNARHGGRFNVDGSGVPRRGIGPGLARRVGTHHARGLGNV